MCDAFLLKDNKRSLKNIQKLGEHFSNIIEKEKRSYFYDEIQSLRRDFREVSEVITSFITRSSSKNCLEAWKTLKNDYPLIYKLAQAIQTLPYSTASIERNFSQLADIKTIKRNRLGVANTQACLLIKQELKDNNQKLEEIFPKILEYYSAAKKKALSKESNQNTLAGMTLEEEKKESQEMRDLPISSRESQVTQFSGATQISSRLVLPKLSESQNLDAQPHGGGEFTLLMIPAAEHQRVLNDPSNALKRGAPYIFQRVVAYNYDQRETLSDKEPHEENTNKMIIEEKIPNEEKSLIGITTEKILPEPSGDEDPEIKKRSQEKTN